ncbi:unnamed protein product [Leptosia nina]|uniref:Transposase Tc1-like domain-containing protein n=1 Tax=Leptosia nina TaxID=320188 RepID=A0AAV1JZV2_9NEOP
MYPKSLTYPSISFIPSQHFCQASTPSLPRQYPHPRHPGLSHDYASISACAENRAIAPSASGGGRQLDVRTEERVLDVLRREPRLGTRSVAKRLGLRHGRPIVSHSKVHAILKRNRMRPYKIHRVQALLPVDRVRRTEFCRWLIQQDVSSPGFLERVI